MSSAYEKECGKISECVTVPTKGSLGEEGDDHPYKFIAPGVKSPELVP